MEYLSDEDYAIAKENGISKIVAYRRFYEYGWRKEKAISHPMKRTYGEFAKIAEANGINGPAFYSRVRNGMSPEEASTHPLIPKGKSFKESEAKITQEVIEAAAENGIGLGTLKQRVYVYRWPVEKAVNTPVDSSKRRKTQEELKQAYANLEKFAKNIRAIDTTGTYKTRTNDFTGRKKQAAMMSNNY